MRTSGRSLAGAAVSKVGGGAGSVSSVRLARQRRPGVIAAAVMLLVLAVATNVYLFRSSGERVSVVRVARDVAVGHEVVSADLDVARVAVAPGVAVVPGRQLGQVVGRRAAVGLRRGTLLAASQLTVEQGPPVGRALVVVPLKSGVVPPGLAAGWGVRVVFTYGTQGQGPVTGAAHGRAQITRLRDVAAVVDGVEGPDAEGVMSVSLMVPDADSGAVARQAAAGMVVLVVTARRG
ncbi:SAF domain-containing protein [Actinomadura pelletieri DSM 43383]|uniref:SAF domain-containing protein n=1 Tax=Actinomadura pelletieri DSM 43383 TaxID=1120940 RepID=A0A495Q9U3_9ACTN|nr:SAF domain-containing protein [Actinomadura pelletieri DSM 43383]